MSLTYKKEKEDGPLSFAIVPSRSSRRIYYLDVLRVVACMAVVMIHASAPYLGKDIGSFNFWVGNVLDSLSRVAVPLFVMISGALMLDEKYVYTAEKLKKKPLLYQKYHPMQDLLLYQVL